jgi:ribosome-associated heat shock protein Hsp15
MTSEETIRLDKWLWAARFFKSRALATQAINGGKVHVNGQRSKPGKIVTAGAQISISKAELKWDITVLGINKNRRPAKEAVLLYEESDESKTKRQKIIQDKRSTQTTFNPKPDKKNRRLIRAFTGNLK